MPIRAIAYLLLATLFFAIQDALFKQLGQQYAVVQLLLYRMTMVVTIMFLLHLSHRQRRPIVTRHWRLMSLRGVIAYTAFTLYYLALQKIPLANGATVFMTAPLFVTALSVPLLAERIGIHRWGAVGIGFIAVVVMLQPTSDIFRPIMALPLLSALIYALIPIITRLIESGEKAFTITFHTTLSYWVLCILASVLVHLVPPSDSSTALYTAYAQPWPAMQWPSLALIAITASLFCISVLLLTSAYRLAQASAVTSFEYSYLVWAIVTGYLFFGDKPSALTWMAAIVIASCGVYITLRERRLAELA